MVAVAALGAPGVGLVAAHEIAPPSMLGRGAPTALQPSFRQLEMASRPVVDDRGEVMSTATYGSTFTSWAGVDLHPSGGLKEAFGDLIDLDFDFSVDKTTYLFAVPADVLATDDARIRVSDGHDLPFSLLELDEVNDIAVVAVESDREEVGDVPDFSYAEDALGSSVDPVWLMVRRDPGRSDSAGFALARGSLGERLEDGTVEGALPVQSLGSPAIALFEDEWPRLAGIVTRLGPESATVTNYAELERLLFASASQYLERTEDMGTIGVSTISTGKARAAGEYDGAARGALVRGLEPGSPAGAAGMRVGDVVTSVGLYPITCASELVTIVRIVGAKEVLELSVTGADGVRRKLRVDARP